eukprot:12372003-Alexandrium_andersonii.AAC.1
MTHRDVECGLIPAQHFVGNWFADKLAEQWARTIALAEGFVKQYQCYMKELHIVREHIIDAFEAFVRLAPKR